MADKMRVTSLIEARITTRDMTGKEATSWAGVEAAY
jgi:hypothetical protein